MHNIQFLSQTDSHNIRYLLKCFQLSDANEFVRKMNVVSLDGGDKKADEKAKAEEAAEERRKKPANQKFGLLEALLRVGAWAEAESLMGRMPAYYAVAQPKIAEALAELVHVTLDPVHRKCCGGTVVRRTRARPPLGNSREATQ